MNETISSWFVILLERIQIFVKSQAIVERTILSYAWTEKGKSQSFRLDMKLTEKTCVPCQGDIPPLTYKEAVFLLGQVPGWILSEAGDKLRKSFTFSDFSSALEFVNLVGEIAEADNHHPDISFGWGYAEIVVYTHKIKGLHENDFILAAKVSEIV